MESFSLKIKAVHSALVSIEESQRYTKSGLQLARHQVETLNAFADPEIDIIFNTAMTGDGKTLAAFLPALLNGKRALASYPTNELIRDQERSLRSRLKDFGYPADSLKVMHSEEITSLMDEHAQEVRPDEVKNLIGEADLLLTNPDLFHLLMSDQYGWFQRREFSEKLQQNYHYYIFDEFHIFGPPQVISVVNIINAIAVERRQSGARQQRKFIFLSATPDKLLEDILTKSGLRFHKVRGDYSDAPLADGLSRRILAPCTLHLTPLSRDSGGIEQWVRDHTEELVDFYRTYPGSKGALIVNSVAAARRLVEYLKPPFEKAGFSVGENTGLTHKGIRTESFSKDLLVGTSTVDVGVDFQINLLIFEANSSADFLQRFGRLGRHGGYIRNGQLVQFDQSSYRAYALCPRFVCERIAKGVGLVDENGQTIKIAEEFAPLYRPDFNLVIKEVFPDRQLFKNYARRWGLLQAAPFVIKLERPRYDDNYAEQREALVEQFATSFGTNTGTVWHNVHKHHELNKDVKGKSILEEIKSFRGTSLSCGVWDTTDNGLKTYSLLYILANSRFEVVSQEEFMAEAARRGEHPYTYRFQLMYLKVHQYLPEADNFSFKIASLNFSREHRDMLEQAVSLVGLEVQNLPRSNIAEVNRLLKGKRLVCTVTRQWSKPLDLKNALKLPPTFAIHSLGDRLSTTYCVAFGKEALLLDSLLFYRKNRQDEGAFFDFELEK